MLILWKKGKESRELQDWTQHIIFHPQNKTLRPTPVHGIFSSKQIKSPAEISSEATQSSVPIFLRNIQLGFHTGKKCHLTEKPQKMDYVSMYYETLIPRLIIWGKNFVVWKKKKKPPLIISIESKKKKKKDPGWITLYTL